VAVVGLVARGPCAATQPAGSVHGLDAASTVPSCNAANIAIESVNQEFMCDDGGSEGGAQSGIAYRQLAKRINARTMAMPASTHLPQKYQPLLRRQPNPS
jgi:hypothetical protein